MYDKIKHFVFCAAMTIKVTLFHPLLMISLLLIGSCNFTGDDNSKNPESGHAFTNHLINESSPYLLQHAHNPVDWYPWGEEALAKAKAENKLLIISIGYAACHWCHVMEKECFEDTAVARIMNEKFVSVKIDREERPDIDQVYMNAVQLLTGSGGWPLNCIALPDGRPIYGGTYFPKDEWINMLIKIDEYVKENPEKVQQQADRLTEGIKSSELIELQKAPSEFSGTDVQAITKSILVQVDFNHGGIKSEQKFPLPVTWNYLLHYNYHYASKDALDAVTLTLNKMANGGIFDHIGGGFARYTTDSEWKIPHFEKMLYDNAQLVSLYCAAYKQTQNPLYKSVVAETLEFINRELTSPEGGFYSSLDADTEGEEGKYYVWKSDEILKVLGNEAGIFSKYYNVTDRGNWEHGKNILFADITITELATILQKDSLEIAGSIMASKKKLFIERNKRPRPALDDKILTSWNALMLKAYVDAYKTFGNENYLKSAVKNAQFISGNVMDKNFRLFRNYKSGKAAINGFLDDYAFTASAFIALYQATFDEKWLITANSLMEYTIEHFYDKESGMFFYTSNLDPQLIARKMDVADNVIPSSNSELAKVLFTLGTYLYNNQYLEMSEQMMHNVRPSLTEGGAYFSNWSQLLLWNIHEPFEIAIVGDSYNDKRKAFDRLYLPDVLLCGGKAEGKLELLENKLIPGATTIYVCRNKSCRLPVNEVKDALKQLKN